MKRKFIIAIVVVVVLAVVSLRFIVGGSKPTHILRTELAREGELELTVTATGSIQPVMKVDVGTQVSGIVTKIYVDYNSQVKQGELLAELDKSTLLERVRQARASLENAQSDEKLATQSYNRTKALYDQKAATLAALEETENRVTTAKGRVTTANADYQQALVNLSYADIYSPISGRILYRAVDQGQTVAASFNTPTLFTIANDLTKMQVEVNVDEADIGRVKEGQKVDFTVDTYPGEVFAGEVSQIRLEPNVSSNVVTYTVVVSAPNPDERLFPGMTASVTIITQSPHGVIVPTEALYFDLDIEQLKEYAIENSIPSGNKVWVKRDNKIKAIAVTAGASDGVETIILTGVNIGDDIVLGVETVAKKRSEEEGFKLGPPKAAYSGMMN